MNVSARVLPQPVSKPQFGVRVKVEGEGAAAVGVAALTTTVAPTVLGGSASATVGSGLTTGGTGLMSTGPQSSAANSVLHYMGVLGSEGAAAWSAANPSLGGSAQIAVGSALKGVGGGASSSVKSKSPN
jgi:hypothetical protein